ncbi:uncharacterized protein CIMG_03955 [Coccidioides immitis RS]|uniref:WW domain-containing protein n=4 Tax=Coccidioides immitis TaxID=5501 RepID=J3KCG6_COCIM|nr:uncharacterized protein CIMG_03955 [Coccidioides immitis RS]KMP08207.1 hypothetical protein CIRG_07888 [Coccidioides immitis RMSCC 2394]KMU79514.1 hypothetical protein CISG_01932 [Coccidioides immitis RMSCC 3703]KMU89914.1 hypothetical protein CIHG_07597 [Coccidioides immitis H538.4]TPX19897.1 hypothetical protein DIZ76_017690 [Coccidioides immitis]EAS32931.3 hypothetical protein CIMG_03955 [Coccidioides immitis RS]
MSYYGQQPPPPQGPAPPEGAPSLPPGWVSQWDQNYQRWYYIEQATGRSQWEPPAASPPPQGPPPPMPPGWTAHWDSNVRRWYVEQVGDRDAPDFSAPPQQGPYPTPPVNAYSGGGAPGYPDLSAETTTVVEEKKEKKKKEGHGTGALVAAGVGGLAVGALGGALIAHEMGDSSSSDDEREVDEDEFATLAEKRRELQEAQEEFDQAWEEAYDD